MDYNMMLSLLEEMYKVNNYEKDADYLFELVKKHVKADEKEKEYQAGVIKQFLFYTFLGAINKKSKDEIYNINVNINEFRNKVKKNNPTWRIENYGAYKLKKVDDSFVVEETIERDHENGFCLTEDSSLSAIEFMEKNNLMLNLINDYMCRKEEIINYEYQTKPGIPREFTEKLIDYIGFRRIEKVNSNEENIKR